jgi:predicted RNA-binding Zn-ribbon protein involved in translation (DUF1610 family)
MKPRGSAGWPGLPNVTPIACEKCGSSAKLASSKIDGFSRGLRETLVYECPACGHQTIKTVDRQN